MSAFDNELIEIMKLAKGIKLDDPFAHVEYMTDMKADIKAIKQAISKHIIGDDEPSNARPDKLKQSPPWQRNQVRDRQRKALWEGDTNE